MSNDTNNGPYNRYATNDSLAHTSKSMATDGIPEQLKVTVTEYPEQGYKGGPVTTIRFEPGASEGLLMDVVHEVDAYGELKSITVRTSGSYECDFMRDAFAWLAENYGK